PRACSLAVQGGQNAGCCRPASGSKAERLSFPLCPRKRTCLLILELLSPPRLSERRHRGLARRLLVVRRRAAFMDCLEVNRLEHLGEIEFESFLATQPERIP